MKPNNIANKNRSYCRLLILITGVFVFTCDLSVAQADQFKNGLRKIVEKFDPFLSSAEDERHMVVRSFINSQKNKPTPISKDIEETLKILFIEKYANRPNIKMLERERLEAIEKEVHFETNSIHFSPDAWQKKLGKKIGAGFLVTGTFRKLTRHLLIRAKMIDIVTGQVMAYADTEIGLLKIDPAILKGIDPPPKKTSNSQKAGSAEKKDPLEPPSHPVDSGKKWALVEKYLTEDEYDPESKVWDLPDINPPPGSPDKKLVTITATAMAETPSEACDLAKTKATKEFFKGRHPTNDYFVNSVYQIYCNVKQRLPNDQVRVEIMIDFYKGRSE